VSERLATCSSRLGSRRRRRGRSMSAVSRAAADSAGRSDSRHATRPRVPPGSNGRRQPADTRHTPVPDQAPRRRRHRPASFQRRLRPARPRRHGDVRRQWSSNSSVAANKQRCCWLLIQSLPDMAVSLHYRQMLPTTPAPVPSSVTNSQYGTFLLF